MAQSQWAVANVLITAILSSRLATQFSPEQKIELLEKAAQCAAHLGTSPAGAATAGPSA